MASRLLLVIVAKPIVPVEVIGPTVKPLLVVILIDEILPLLSNAANPVPKFAMRTASRM